MGDSSAARQQGQCRLLEGVGQTVESFPQSPRDYPWIYQPTQNDQKTQISQHNHTDTL